MKKGIHIIFFFLVQGCCVPFTQAQKQSLQTYHLSFSATVNGSPFSFDSVYRNHFGEAFRVRNFRYYISHIRLVYTDGKTISSHLAPHLVNDADSSSEQLVITAPKGSLAAIRFLLGIDSATNVNGVQSGDLDPAKGMFWIWNTGYIMARLEGSSPASKAPGKQYSYDIGGYKSGENAAREISLTIEPAVSRQSSAISHKTSAFIITADIGRWFYGKNDIRISEQPMCHSPGNFAMQIADNYAAMFSIRAQ